MTDAEGQCAPTLRGVAAVKLRVAAKLENLAVLRGRRGRHVLGPRCRAVADLRLAVDEACTRLIRSAAPDATLVVVVDPRDDVVVVEASAECETFDVVTPSGFSWHVLKLAHRRHGDVHEPERSGRPRLRHHPDHPRRAGTWR